MVSRRSVMALLGIGVAGAGGYGYSEYGSVAAMQASISGSSGQRRFEFRILTGGYDYAEWQDDGTLVVAIEDDPPMEEWILIGPDPEREILASGIPSPTGGTETIEFGFPIESGEYTLSGFEVVANEDSLLGIDAERTGDATMDFEFDLELVDITQNNESPQKAEMTIRNTGSKPFEAAGVRFSDDVPGTGTRKHEFFEDGAVTIVPTEEATVVSRSLPFIIPNEGPKTEVPDEYGVSIYADDIGVEFDITPDGITKTGENEEPT